MDHSSCDLIIVVHEPLLIMSHRLSQFIAIHSQFIAIHSQFIAIHSQFIAINKHIKAVVFCIYGM